MLILSIGFGVLILFILVIVPFGFSYMLTHANSRPSDRAINADTLHTATAFREVEFKSKDGVLLSGWYLPRENAPADR